MVTEKLLGAGASASSVRILGNLKWRQCLSEYGSREDVFNRYLELGGRRFRQLRAGAPSEEEVEKIMPFLKLLYREYEGIRVAGRTRYISFEDVHIAEIGILAGIWHERRAGGAGGASVAKGKEDQAE